MVDQLIKAGADPNPKSLHDHTALIAAVEQGNEAVVDLLIKAGGDINGKGQWGIPASRAATRGGHQAMAEQLRLAGAFRLRWRPRMPVPLVWLVPHQFNRGIH